MNVAPSKNATFPPGVAAKDGVAVTVAVKVTSWPTAGEAFDEVTAVEVPWLPVGLFTT